MDSIDNVFEELPIPDGHSQYGNSIKDKEEISSIEGVRPYAQHYELELPSTGLGMNMLELLPRVLNSIQAYFSILDVELQEPVRKEDDYYDTITYVMRVDKDTSMRLMLDLDKQYLHISARSFSS